MPVPLNSPPVLLMEPALEPVPVRAALIWGFGMKGCPPSTEPAGFLQELIERARAAGPDFVPTGRKAAVRNMLRFGSYKPSGRSKPASEYLLGAALSSSFPLVNGPVDVNNCISLESGFPASVFDAGLSGLELFVRRGREGESYVFNHSGQTIDLRDLLCVCRKVNNEWVPCGNPVKDSMSTKTSPATTSVVAVLFAPAEEREADLRAAAERYADHLSRHCGAVQTGFSLVDR
jgi:hypothetical protein